MARLILMRGGKIMASNGRPLATSAINLLMTVESEKAKCFADLTDIDLLPFWAFMGKDGNYYEFQMHCDLDSSSFGPNPAPDGCFTARAIPLTFEDLKKYFECAPCWFSYEHRPLAKMEILSSENNWVYHSAVGPAGSIVRSQSSWGWPQVIEDEPLPGADTGNPIQIWTRLTGRLNPPDLVKQLPPEFQ